LDDSRQLATVAALLNANPKLNPTAAIRSLGIEDPSVIRRLRDKYRIEQMKIAAGVSSANSEAALASGSVPTLKSVRAPLHTAPFAVPVKSRSVPEQRNEAPEPSLFVTWFDLGVRAIATVVDQQAAMTQHVLRIPAVTMALRNQLAMSSYVVAICAKGKSRRPHLH
jgi:hypothetical protein